MLFNRYDISVWMEGPRYLAKSLAWGLVAEGTTRDEALDRLRQALASLATDGSLPVLQPVGPLMQGPWCPSSVSWRQALERLEAAGYEIHSETEGHARLTKVIQDFGLRTVNVFVPRPIEGEDTLSVGALNAVLEQAMLSRADFEELAPADSPPTKPWYGLRLLSLVDRED